MKSILFNYLLKNFMKTFNFVILIIFCFGIILNLFEEIEFFKNIEVSIFTPLMLNKYIYTKYDYKTFTIYNFYF